MQIDFSTIIITLVVVALTIISVVIIIKEMLEDIDSVDDNGESVKFKYSLFRDTIIMILTMMILWVSIYFV